jgi:hypothetical protein
MLRKLIVLAGLMLTLILWSAIAESSSVTFSTGVTITGVTFNGNSVTPTIGSCYVAGEADRISINGSIQQQYELTGMNGIASASQSGTYVKTMETSLALNGSSITMNSAFSGYGPDAQNSLGYLYEQSHGTLTSTITVNPGWNTLKINGVATYQFSLDQSGGNPFAQLLYGATFSTSPMPLVGLDQIIFLAQKGDINTSLQPLSSFNTGVIEVPFSYTYNLYFNPIDYPYLPKTPNAALSLDSVFFG